MEDFLRACQGAVLDNEAKTLAAKMGVAHVSLLQRANPDNDAPAFFKVLVASTIQLCRSFLGLLLPIRVQHHRPYWLPVTRLT